MTTPHVPRKRFGQHFLRDNNIIQNIVHALHPLAGENCVEIGAGLGALTNTVLQKIPHLQVVEIDNDLVEKLTTEYPASQLSVHHGDALKFDFSTLYQPNSPLRVFGNLPYNISTPLLFHLLSFAPYIQDMLFMLQKEVVLRICAKPNTADYGRLSVMLQYAFETRQLFDIPPTAFSPPPKVMSTLIFLRPYGTDRPYAELKDQSHFATIVRTAFQHRRKTLKRALETVMSADVLLKADIDPQRRAETLSVAEWVTLSNLKN